jgi:hypothetical protein
MSTMINNLHASVTAQFVLGVGLGMFVGGLTILVLRAIDFKNRKRDNDNSG